MKQCKRCGGNLLSEGDGYDCLQCGCEHDKQGELSKVRNSTLSSFHGGAGFKADEQLRLMKGKSEVLSSV
jgi:hypothetical protein